jgi:hypothetical protein
MRRGADRQGNECCWTIGPGIGKTAAGIHDRRWKRGSSAVAELKAWGSEQGAGGSTRVLEAELEGRGSESSPRWSERDVEQITLASVRRDCSRSRGRTRRCRWKRTRC